MKIRTLPAVLAVVILGFTGAVIAAKANKPPEPPLPGVEQSDHGREHVDSKKYGGDQQLNWMSILCFMLLILVGLAMLMWDSASLRDAEDDLQVATAAYHDLLPTGDNRME